jgi:O-antigen ligase
MVGLVVTLIALATLAFGAVYPWAYLPLYAAAALIGVITLVRGGVRAELRPLTAALVLVWVAVGVQLVPMPRGLLDLVSPRAPALLSAFSVPFATGAVTIWPLSIDPSDTRVALLALAAFVLYVVGLSSQLGGNRLRQMPTALALFAVPLALFGILSREYNTKDQLYWFWQPEQGGGDLFGPFVNRNHFGGWMLMAVCVLVGGLIGQLERTLQELTRRPRRRIEWLSSADANAMIRMGLVVAITVISLFWTLSRSAMTGFAVATAAFAWLTLRRRAIGTTRRTAVLAALGAIALAGIVWRGPTRLVAWFQFPNELSVVGRLDAWRDGWQVVRNFPLTGTGLNTYSDAMLFFQTGNRNYHLAQAHNDYLQLLAEGGLLIAIPVAIAIVLLARAVRRNLRAAEAEARGYWVRAGAAIGMLAIGVQELFEFSLQMPANTLLFCTLAALSLAPVRSRSRREARGNISSNQPESGSRGAVP